jgi:dipeptidyl aminopeptidase/acylaminoacyl peptidase
MLGTEELFFPFFDLGGTPWYDPFPSAIDKTNPATQARRNFGPATFSDWRRWDPAEHLDQWNTPELIIHSAKDFRIAIADGLSAFNVLQARGVESKFLTFPDENHWVIKPENSLVWHKVVLNWINHYVGLPAFTDEDPDSDEFWGGAREPAQELVEMASQGKPEM